ncbi:hypothetical protein DPEC_G00261770 [Dallia pectoralis]|uniref:Uncharacterized protein n=1 Tax=Dallia pectoralis TaxID=75939 RepID=A0ACC2FS33_DALPE|nr:hypothetical protein DPEC_G00261770 [Dallia pectoralis]
MGGDASLSALAPVSPSVSPFSLHHRPPRPRALPQPRELHKSTSRRQTLYCMEQRLLRRKTPLTQTGSSLSAIIGAQERRERSQAVTDRQTRRITGAESSQSASGFATTPLVRPIRGLFEDIIGHVT